jgi:hypothetical protein
MLWRKRVPTRMMSVRFRDCIFGWIGGRLVGWGSVEEVGYTALGKHWAVRLRATGWFSRWVMVFWVLREESVHEKY